ncbi:hypothetical protein CROQUDRAFT_97888 [Cronartium quercuum f. sp. fusiforme G11]|uniref:Nucleoporin Nup54 alpha-helical domain-containing protein n=1 Tax=Cronartium quercuum f. sp. fusiforme G11 TaxID=708437 RepID=A0A9P6T847_9BASI|nr:hypothetical protein CROQUDRAFT_97888 [Cronartium quercuum f. sp. fusiforme G11]
MFGKRTGDSLTGTPTSKPSPFGNNNINNNTPLFGQSQGNPSSNNLFGSTQNQQQQQQQQTSLFGNNNTNNNNQSGSSLFGNNNTNTNHNTPLLGGSTTNGNSNSLFGNNNNTQTSNSLINSTNNSSTSLFSNSTNNNNSNSIFGSSTNNNLLPTNNNSNSLFSNTNNNNNSLLNISSTTNNNNSQSLSNSLINRSKINESIEFKILNIYNSWSLNHPDCKFQYYFYNLVEPDKINQYQIIIKDENINKKVKRNNPNPERFVPSLAVGFEDLQKRLNCQVNMAKIHIQKLLEFEEKINEINQKLRLITTVKLHKLINFQNLLTNKLIKLIIKLPNNDNQQLEDDNDQLNQRIQSLIHRLKLTGGKSRVGELWANLKINHDQIQNHESFKWSIIDQKEIKKVLEVLVNQQKGIDHLKKVLDQSRYDISIISNAFEIRS